MLKLLMIGEEGFVVGAEIAMSQLLAGPNGQARLRTQLGKIHRLEGG